MECWGAQGGPGLGNNVIYQGGGKGGYIKGKITLLKEISLYLYIGNQAPNPKLNDNGRTYEQVEGGWNGGGKGDYDHADDDSAGGGGGSTDIRLSGGTWDNFNSLKSRIMVAGAGGGSGAWGESGGIAGGLTGINSSHMTKIGYSVTPGNQSSGYRFGKGEDGIHRMSNHNAGGGGSGYYGGCEYKGGQIGDTNDYTGAGGSSFISGHTGCNAISSSSTSTNIVHTGQPNHYSGYVFTNTVMKAGNESMPSPTGGTETGHSGNGYCKITWHPSL